MTQVSEEEFLNKLYDVIYKLSTIAKTQSYRFKKIWDGYLKPINDKPHIVRDIPLDKEKFYNDIDNRIEVLKTIGNSQIDGYYSIKSILDTIYNSYFEDSELFKKDFSEEDQLILEYYVAREILGNLVQYNKMDHETVPLKYNIIAREYLMIKLKGITLEDIDASLKKLNKNIARDSIIKIMEEIKEDGIINIEKDGDSFRYTLNKELKLSEDGERKIIETGLKQIIDWPTQWWRSFYNIRELNVTLDENCKYRDFLHKILEKSATQGYSPANFVIKNLVKYYEKVKEESN